jgi:hypothetical protein
MVGAVAMPTRPTSAIAEAPDAPAPDLAFYTVADTRHFIGLVALINSLRLVDHPEPIFVTDAGLLPAERSIVSREATLVPAPRDVPLVALRPVGPLAHPARTSVLLDADVIVVRQLSELIDLARTGRVVAFVDNAPHQTRFFEEWSAVLELDAMRRQPYCNAGQMLVPENTRARLLDLWAAGLRKVDPTRTWQGRSELDYPFYFGDQDVFNAIAASALQSDEITFLDHRLAPHPPFDGLRLVDEVRLVCRYDDGSCPFFLHHTLEKPWLGSTRSSIYSRLLRRLLLSSDVMLPLQTRDVPLRLRYGRRADADRARANVQALAAGGVRRRLGRFGIRTRLRALREAFRSAR